MTMCVGACSGPGHSVGAIGFLALALLTAAPLGAQGLASYALDGDAAEQHELPGRLREVSGLAVTADGRLFAHDDERARVYQIEPRSGEVVKRFDVGEGGVRGDFEGIAIAGDRFYLVESDGTLYEFQEGEEKEDVPYREVKTALGRRCEVEGLAHDPDSGSLLLVCKSTRGRDLRDRLVVFAAPLDTLQPDAEPRYQIPFASLRDVGARGRLHPSGIEVHPVTRQIFVVAAREEGIVEIDRAGRFVGAAELPGKQHVQPEGIAFVADALALADEGTGRKATLTLYPRRRARPGGDMP